LTTSGCARLRGARRYRIENARINIRLATADLEMLERRAAKEGLALSRPER